MKSKFNKRYEFNEKKWIVTLMHSGDKTGGHAKIVVEGISNGKLFIGEYHAYEIPDEDMTSLVARVERQSANQQSYYGRFLNFFDRITNNRKGKLDIVISEKETYISTDGRDKSEYYHAATSSSWICDSRKVRTMITAVKRDYNEQDRGVYRKYSYYGRYNIFQKSDEGPYDNCITLCLDYLRKAGVSDLDPKFIDLKKAIPFAHSHPAAKFFRSMSGRTLLWTGSLFIIYMFKLSLALKIIAALATCFMCFYPLIHAKLNHETSTLKLN